MSDFFRSRGFKVLAAVFVLLFGMIIGSILRNGAAGTVDGIIGVLVTPVRTVTGAVGDFFSGIGNSLESGTELQRQLQELEDKNAELMGQLVDYEEMKRENEQLKELVNLQEANEEMEFAFASVISRGNEPWSNTLGLDKGSIDGVKVGDPVITKDSFLIGHVTKVGATWCTVTTILDITTNVGARLSSSREVGVTECTAELSEKGLCSVSYLPAESGVSRGEIVITSGLSGYYPEGLIIGEVESVSQADDGLSSEAVVRPAADVNEVKDVFVITEFTGRGDSGE